MNKVIDFVMSGKVAKVKFGYGGSQSVVHRELKVDLDQLSPAARAIAKNVYTTDNRDDLSNVLVEGPTSREILERQGNYEEIASMEKYYCDLLDKPVSRIWWFNGLKSKESPEDYFERQARAMKEYGWLRLKNYKTGQVCYTF